MIRYVTSGLAALALAACGGSLGDPPGADVDGGGRGGDGGATGLIDYEPSNIPENHLTVGTAAITFSGDVTINTDTGMITGPGAVGAVPPDSIFVLVDQVEPEAPSLGVFSWANLTVESGVTVSLEGQNGLVFAISENVVIDGIIDASGGQLAPGSAGAGGSAGGDDASPIGFGPGGGMSRGGYDAGGGGGGFGATGGDGGRHEGRDGGTGGLVAGTELNVPLLGGSGGACGGSAPGAGFGGGGGGAVQISSRGEIRLGLSSGINVSAAGGIGGDNDEGAGGGGAGGAILLEGKYVVVDGILAANGGGGGAGANGGNKGTDGMPGAFGDGPANGGTGSGEGTTGGAGAAAEVMIGQVGLPGIGNTGGGGGGAGRIYIRTRESAAMAGTVSPSGSIALGTL